MKTNRVVKIGFRIGKDILSSKQKLLAHLSDKTNLYGRILLTLRDYLIKHSKRFDKAYIRITDKPNSAFANGTLTGLLGEVNRSEIDIGVRPVTMYEASTKRVDFSYPYKFYYVTFVTQKPEYKPHISGILQGFSLSMWITIISVFLMLLLLYYIILKSKYSLDKILLHVLGVLLRQSSVLNHSSVGEKLLLYSWVVGTMFICLAYDSVFLSFLAFPPITPIKDVTQLARAIEKGEYHCVTVPKAGIYSLLLNSNQEKLKILASDLQRNNLKYQDAVDSFFNERNLNLAFLVDTETVDLFPDVRKFVSEDHFFQSMAAMMIRKDFCCKNLIEIFVHRLMASGLYFKYVDDKAFLTKMSLLLKYPEKDNSKRKLILVDVAPAFIVLLSGYFISFIAFVAEKMSHNRRKVDNLRGSK